MCKGLVIPILERYEAILFENLYNLVIKYNFTLPIELWQVGKEISNEMCMFIKKIQKKHNIIMKNVKEYTNDIDHWKGFQIKAFAVKFSEFDEIILCDCDVLFGMNPTIIFNDPNYIKYGCFFFRDWLYHKPESKDEFINRIHFINYLLPEKNEFFPHEWDYIYTHNYNIHEHTWYYLEAGVVFINRKKHNDIITTIFDLNYNWKETYQYIPGDKETFWLAFVMNNKPFYMNDTPGTNIILDKSKVHYNNSRNDVLTHTYKNKFFFSQKGYPQQKKM
jgi:alpha 1,3-mannosyltransferase